MKLPIAIGGPLLFACDVVVADGDLGAGLRGPSERVHQNEDGRGVCKVRTREGMGGPVRRLQLLPMLAGSAEEVAAEIERAPIDRRAARLLS